MEKSAEEFMVRFLIIDQISFLGRFLAFGSSHPSWSNALSLDISMELVDFIVKYLVQANLLRTLGFYQCNYLPLLSGII